jgi:hypothetical protein
MPKAIFCLFSRRDKEAEKKIQAWQKAYSRQGWETSILSHEHGAGFADEIRLGLVRLSSCFAPKDPGEPMLDGPR